jgi:hypothetical protein
MKQTKKCYNCKFASEPFKVAGKTYIHCQHEKYRAGMESGELSGWDTLMEFWEKCPDHAFKNTVLDTELPDPEKPFINNTK